MFVDSVARSRSPYLWLFVFIVAICAAVAACGRSELDDDLVIGASGATGASGASGATGASGASGSTGTTGSAGTVTGSAGTVTGSAGAAGASGTPVACSMATCPIGCCDSNGKCEAGTANNACGIGGAACRSCVGATTTCDPMLRACVLPPACGPTTCPNGCCSGNSCINGITDAACGSGGETCEVCTANESCLKSASGPTRCQFLTPPCSSSCAGCCDPSGNCQAGFLDSQCGQQGAACTNCDALSPPSTCNTNSMPRVCTSQQSACPSPYAGCAPGTTMPPVQVKHVCSVSDFDNAASACASSAHTPGCAAFFQFEQMQNPACASCLSAFDYDYAELTGLIACLSPFVSSACSNDLGCLDDCENQSCASCIDPSSKVQCRDEVANTTCANFVNGAQCIQSAFLGPGLFCDPFAYAQFGVWLAAVGSNYCHE